jgi:hypothetical protein
VTYRLLSRSTATASRISVRACATGTFSATCRSHRHSDQWRIAQRVGRFPDTPATLVGIVGHRI